MSDPTASIVITNYNYGTYVGAAIESALAQTYRDFEVLVVDDGSTDGSREAIASYGDRVVAIYQENRGQAAAFNAGLARSRGGIVVFLDSDDALLPEALERCVPMFDHPEVVKAHWPLWIVDRKGNRKGRLCDAGRLPQGDCRPVAYRLGPTNLASPPTSGNAWARSYLEQVFPVPEDAFRICADMYLFECAPFFGQLRAHGEPLGLYRVHGENSYASLDWNARRRRALRCYDHIACRLLRHCEARGIRPDLDEWGRHNWWLRQEQAVREMQAIFEPGSRFVFVDDGAWDIGPLGGCMPVPFLEKEGRDWGAPPDDATALATAERLRQAGNRYFVFAWSSFWWLDFYSGLHGYLRQFQCPLESERLVIFDMRQPLSGGCLQAAGQPNTVHRS